MTMRQIDRLKVVQALADGHLKTGIAASRLGLTPRQTLRLLRRYQQHGAAGLLNRHQGQPANNRTPPGLAARVLGLIRDNYADFGPTLAAEKLRERHGIDLAKETVRRLMIDAGFWVPRKQRPPKVHQPRNRRACLGELVQIDGSDHAWFEDRAPACTLLVFVDDATSRLMALRFVPTESAFAYFEATRAYLECHGKPIAFYSDKASVFRVNRPSATGGDGYTQFGRALYELNIDSLCANSSQAKGRVERMNGTLQDRLVKELRLRGISSQADANAFVAVFVADFNGRFAKPPRSDFNAHRPVRADEDLARIFTWREWRKVSASLTLQYDKTLYLLADQPEHRALIHRYIEVAEYPDGRIELWADGASLPYTTYDRLAEIDQGAIVENKRLGHVLRVAQEMQAKRDSRRSAGAPARTTAGTPPRPRKAAPGKKPQRQLSPADLQAAIEKTFNAPLPYGKP
ncbi:integrase-like protein [Cupriavidus phytorum]|uniref:Integrase-like protein n=2 Tax=Cupriavidus phytorum TaxID=3024399 RepID=A0A2W7NV46_9BURK|nr:integrase-like protein [Cupriavidus alkaliphilus]